MYVSDQSNTNNNSYDSSDSYDAPNGQTGDSGGIFITGGPTEYFQTTEIEVFEVIYFINTNSIFFYFYLIY